MANIFQVSPLISLVLTMLMFCMVLSCLMLRPSAKRTILLTTSLKKMDTKRKLLKKDRASPLYMWMVQPTEETGLKEGDHVLCILKI